MDTKGKINLAVASLCILILMALNFMRLDTQARKSAVIGTVVGVLAMVVIAVRAYYKTQQLDERQRELQKTQTMQKAQNYLGSSWFLLSLVLIVVLMVLQMWKLF